MVLKTPSGTSEYTACEDEKADSPAVAVQVGKTELKFLFRGIDDLHKMLKAKGDWMPLGSANEQKTAEKGTEEAWARPRQPRGRMVRNQKGLRGRFANYVPSILEALGLAEVDTPAR